MTNTTKTTTLKTADIAYIGLFVAIMAICSWISIPATVPFTLQTFAIFTAIGLLGGRRGSIAVVTYVLLGAIGIPVFSGFSGGLGILLGTTGGYIIGFIFSALAMWGITAKFGDKALVLGISMVIGLAICYAFGTAWFMLVYMHQTGPVGLATVLGWCVIPFIIPDLCKIGIALILTKRLKRFVRL